MLCGFHRAESGERVLMLFRGGSLFASNGVPSATSLLNIEVIVSVRSVVSGLVHLHGRSPLLAVRRSLFILTKVYHTGMEKSTLFLHLFFVIELSELSDNSIGQTQKGRQWRPSSSWLCSVHPRRSARLRGLCLPRHLCPTDLLGAWRSY